MKLIKTKKGYVLLAALVVALAASIGAYAYFTSNGSGTGSASVGTSSSLTITQTNAVSGLLPDGATHTVAFSIANTSTAAQNLGKVTVSNISVDEPYASNGCQASWFTANAPAGAVGTIAGGLTYNSAPGTQPSIQMNDSGGNQDVCQGATLTLTLTAAQGS